MKKILGIILVTAGIAGGYMLYVGQKSVETAEDKTSDFVISTSDLFNAFEEDALAADTKFNNKTIELTGVISEVSLNGDYTDVLFESETMSTVNIQLIPDMKDMNLTPGSEVTIKGIYRGYNEELGIDVELNQGVILNGK